MDLENKMRHEHPLPVVEPAGEQRPAPTPAGGLRAAAMAMVLVVLVVTAFSPCLQNDFVMWDDDRNFLENLSYRGLGWPQIRWAWTSFQLGVYQPLAWMILEAQYVLFGLRPWGYHVTSLVLYILNTVVLFRLTLALLNRAGSGTGELGPWAPMLGAGLAVALFAVHPLRTEVVAWASCQPYLPCALFSMLAVLAYLRAFPEESSAPRPAWLVGSFCLFLAALLSKAVAVSLPAVLVILDVYPLRRLGGGPGRWFGPPAWRVWSEKIPFGAMSVIFVILAVIGRMQERHLASYQTWGIAARATHACYAIWFYVLKTVVPRDLITFYPIPERLVWFESPFIWAILMTLGVSVAAFRLAPRWPGLLAVWSSYLLILAPNVGLVRIGQQLAADRYSYMATMGGVVLVAGVLCRAWPGWHRRWPAAVALIALGLGVLPVLILLSRAQCLTWRTSEILWTHALSHGGTRAPVAHNGLGLVRFDQGRLDEAKAELVAALWLYPDYADAHVNLAAVLTARGQIEQARAELAEALRLKPDSASAYNNLGVTEFRQGRLDQAIANYTEALRLNPGDASVHANLGAVRFRQGRADEAIAHYDEALRLNPGYADAHANRARVLMVQGRIDKAKAELIEALRLKPNIAEAHGNLGVVLMRQGRLDEAIAHYHELLRLAPQNVDAHFNLGLALSRQGRLDQAIEQFSAVLRIMPDDLDAHDRLAIALTQRGRLAEALTHYGEILRLRPGNPEVYNKVGMVLRAQGRYPEALAHLGEALRLKPDSVDALNNRAQIWATAPDARYRDGLKAVESATRACELTSWENPVILDTYAAACAEVGDFSRAAKWQVRASVLVIDAKQRAEFRARLRLYQASQPYRQGVDAR
jgi:tetratricopeptide (TPR) repeat protein